MAGIFSKTIKILRKEKGLTQGELSIIIGTKQGYISEIERDLKTPGGEILISLKRAYPDLNLEWLFTGQGEMFVAERQTVPLDPALLKPLNQAAGILDSGTSAARFLKGQIETAQEMMLKDQELARIKGEATESPQTGTDNYGR